MKHKSLYLIGSVAMLSLMLAGCGKSSPTNHSTQSQSNSTTQTTGQNSSKQSSQLWNKSKDQQLSDFINQWAPTMGQSYTKYDGHTDIRTKSGMHYPSDFDQTTVNGTHDSMGWAPSGKGSYDYNVVALYNYDRPGGAAGHITYAFAFHDGQPVALVDQSTNGTANWTPTKNADVSSNFARIANGSGSSSKSQSSSSNSNSQSSSVDDKTVGVLVALLQNPNWFKEYLNSGDMHYGANSDNSGEVNGYSYVTSNGDPESYIYFKRDGDNITIKQWTTSGDETVAEGHFETKTISLKRLENDYYSNVSKRAEVNGYVNKLKQ
ncbi:MAG: DUF4767 domain-containing protein [Lactobacillus sp.]|uniref:Lreu_0056 family protein n=1 Tax=Limosilactobacillus coleohominis TaxID=181675 RepID=UPI002A91BACE|nr:DUF4767 domain-containing protein [Limosilactobacillus coleohominis]MCI5813269.1 DUF4767 domain-containing protein [Lactobacillus sp.]MDY5628451.1 DUF4767 domain-containing protein [Limosilactobacillus coleohominis]